MLQEDGAINGIKLPVDPKAAAELALAGLGVALQLGLLGAFPAAAVLKAPLAPLLAFEAYLKATAVATAAAASAKVAGV